MPTDLSLLTCGRPITGSSPDGSELGDILAHVQASLDYVMEQIIWLGAQEPRRASMLGPFLGRSLLELAATALIGRLDPLRVLVLRRIQDQPGYDTKVPWKASIRWQGDVLTSKVKEPWGAALEYKEMTKALLGDYYDHLVWQPAIRRLSDNGLTDGGGAWLADLKAIGVENFVARKRDAIGQLYSSLSKGIHPEFVMPPGALYDRSTIVDLIQRAVRLIADIGLVSHFVTHAAFTLRQDEAVKLFNRVETIEVMK